jgi:sensor histidine kinase regulating citrate/malate metabolism
MKKITPTEKELNRLVTNQKAFLDAIPQPVLIVNGTESIEFMNSGARKFFINDSSTSKESEKKSSEFFQRLITSLPSIEKNNPGSPSNLF